MARVIETTCLFLLLSLVALRPLVAESYESAGSAMTAALEQVSDPSPLRTLAFDGVIVLSACAWGVSRLRTPRDYRGTGLEWGAVLVAVAVAISCLYAGNRRLAINAGIDWLCHPLLAIVLVQLLTSARRRRLLYAAVVASACVQAFQCAEQAWIGFDETWRHYQTLKESFWAQQGVALDSPQVALFEQRMRARDAQGFFPHSNVTGAYLALCDLTALGLTIRGFRNHGGSALSLVAMIGRAVVTAALMVAVVLTRSFGAVLAAAGAGTLWLLWRRWRPWIDAHRRHAFALGWLVFVVGAGAVVGHGLYHGSLPNVSLNFRWQYWRTATTLIADHPLTGVGRENFGRVYLRYKPIDAPEEIANPHNLFVQAAAEWGLPGLAGVVLMLLGGSWTVVRRGTTNDETLPAPAAGATARPPEGATEAVRYSRPPLLAWTVGLLAVMTLARLPLLGTDDPNFLYYASVTAGLCWLWGWVCFAGLGARTVNHGPPPPGGEGTAFALLALLVHEMINFALFVPGSATTFFALFAGCVAERTPAASAGASTAPTALRRWAPLVGALALAIVMLRFAVVPVGRAQYWIARAQTAASRVASTGQPADVDELYQRAARSDPWDPTPCALRAKWLATSEADEPSEAALTAAVAALHQAVGRDPHAASHHRALAQLHQRLARLTGNPEHYRRAVVAAQAALERYPLDPDGVAALADREREAAAATNDQNLARRAAVHYRQALELDDARPEWEKLRRLPPHERRRIEELLK
ncbi:MAG: O-antigen ligase family protein [Planctomycetes bacterium]|nr:O-antigen ligase family protein [Planctomycetota bacterium]